MKSYLSSRVCLTNLGYVNIGKRKLNVNPYNFYKFIKL